MSELILVMIVYFVFRMLKESAKKRVPPEELPEYRSPGHDLPLPGPWNRRTEKDAEAETSMSGPLDVPGAPRDDDAQLPGPWDKKGPRPAPVEPKAEPRRKPGYEPETAAESGPVREQRQKPRREEKPRDRAVEQVMVPKPRPVPGIQVPGREPVPRDAVEPKSREAVAVWEQPPGRRRQSHPNPLAAVLGSQSTLVGSIVLGQVLGTRGGRAAEKRNPARRL